MKNNKRTITIILLIPMLLVLGARQYKINALTRELGTTNNNIKASKEEYNKLNKTVRIKNILYKSTDNFHIEEGEIGIEFADGSWASINQAKNQYTFQPYMLGDWSYDFDNIEDFKNCITTYLNIANKGTY